MNANNWNLLRYLVVPAMFIAAMVRHPAAQWCALGILCIWVILQISQTIARKKAKARHMELQEAQIKKEEKEIQKEDISQTEFFLIRQINHRITEHLKQAYPTIAWIWVKRPSLEELEAGGSWRIQLSNAAPYNYGEVSIKTNGAMSITLILAAPLRQPEMVPLETVNDDTELKPSEELDRTDALTWYTEYGGNLLASMIDDLNTQGHKKLTIHDDGEVFVKAGDKEIAVDKLEWFLPRIAWTEFITLLKEDGINASAEDAGLVLTW